MKKKINPIAAIAVIAVAIGIIALILYRSTGAYAGNATDNPYNRGIMEKGKKAAASVTPEEIKKQANREAALSAYGKIAIERANAAKARAAKTGNAQNSAAPGS